MNADLMNISAIEDFLYSVLYNKVSKQVFLGGLPSTIDSRWEDMVVIDASNTINDLNAFGLGTVTILLYAGKNNHNGTKNSPVISSLSKKLNASLSNYTCTNYAVKRVGVVSDKDNVTKLFYDAVILRIMIA